MFGYSSGRTCSRKKGIYKDIEQITVVVTTPNAVSCFSFTNSCV